MKNDIFVALGDTLNVDGEELICVAAEGCTAAESAGDDYKGKKCHFAGPCQNCTRYACYASRPDHNSVCFVKKIKDDKAAPVALGGISYECEIQGVYFRLDEFTGCPAKLVGPSGNKIAWPEHDPKTLYEFIHDELINAGVES